MNQLQPQWAAIATAVTVLLVVLAGVLRGLRAKDHVFSKYRDERERTRATIEGEAIIPSLAALFSDIYDRALEDGIDVMTSLQRVRYRPALEDLNSFYRDLILVDSLPRQIERWMRIGAVGLIAFATGAVIVVTPYCISGEAVAISLTVLGYVLVGAGLLCAGSVTAAEAMTRNRLVSTFEKYDNFQVEIG